MSTLKTGALRGTSGTADSVQLHASDQSVTFPGNVTVTGTLTNSGITNTGKIGQAVQYDNTGRTNVPDSNWVGVGSVTITPTASTSKILVLASMSFGLDSSNAEVNYILASFRLTWNHSGISETQLQHKRYSLQLPEDTGTDMIIQGAAEFMLLHDHNTANEITYEIEAKTTHDSSHLEVTSGGSGVDNKTITCLEIL